MRVNRLFLLCFCAALWFPVAAGAEQQTTGEDNTMNTAAAVSKEHMESYYQVYNSENPQELRKYYADNVVLVSGQGEQKGADAILQTYQYLIANFHDKMTPTNISIDGNTAVVDIVDRFTAKTDVEDFMGMSLKTGESFEINIRGTYQVEDGKFKRINIEMLQ